MTAREWEKAARARLLRSGSPDPGTDAQLLLAGALGLPRGRLLFHMDDSLSDEQFTLLEEQLARREGGEPLQYVQGVAYFMGLEFLVDRRVLIPRQDTETLCELALSRIRPGDSVLDLCTGSGALAVTIARCGRARVTGADISADALQVARENAARNGASVKWAQGDLFEAVPGQTFDAVVCNPPYLTAADMADLQTEVGWEPPLALAGGADGLDFYRRIAGSLAGRLKPGGRAFFEVGAGQAAAVREIFAGALPGARVRVQKDLCGVERVVWMGV